MAEVAEKLQPWLAALERRPTGAPRWLQDLRDRAAARFAALGFPTVREEEWRFTNVAPITSTEFAAPPAGAAISEDELTRFHYAEDGFRIAIVNGRFSRELSRLKGLPTGVRVMSLAAAVEEKRSFCISRRLCA